MTDRTVVVYGDGKHELGGQLGKALARDELPALPMLVDRLLDAPPSVRYVAFPFAQVPHARGKEHKLAKKVKRAILLAKAQKHAGAVILVDRDRLPDSERIKPLQEGRSALEHDLACPPCAVGMAVEAFDAWMIADGGALGKAGGNAARSHPSPETMDGVEGTGRHPKDRAAEVFGGGQGLGDKYAQVASHVDLGLLAKCCPKGFAPFAEEVTKRILPAVRA
ncbi:MAG: DUF4276 family protein [Phycisphaerae bacterium]